MGGEKNLERIRRVIDSGMDDFAVARTGGITEGRR